MVAEPKQLGWQFWLQWFVATLVGVAVGAVFVRVGELSAVRATGSDFGDLVFGAGLGLGIGVCQRWPCHRLVREECNDSARESAGLAMGWFRC